jgi:probable phosphoglycerate mutase
MRSFYFLRHGLTDWNVAGRLQGRDSFIPLNDTGLAQARGAAAVLATMPINLIVASPLERAATTARIVADHIQAPVQEDARLAERFYGAIEGMTTAEIEASDPQLLFDLSAPIDWQGYRLPKGAETMLELAIRAHDAVFEHLHQNDGKNVLFVAHGAWFRALVHRLTDGQEIIRSDNAVPYACHYPRA